MLRLLVALAFIIAVASASKPLAPLVNQSNALFAPITSSSVDGVLLRGFHGQSLLLPLTAGTYNLISEYDVSINAVYSDVSAAPPRNGGVQLTAITIITSGGSRVRIAAGDSADRSLASVTVNGANIAVGESVALAYHAQSIAKNGGVERISASAVSVTASIFQLNIGAGNNGALVIESLAVTYWSRIFSHGLIGQTWTLSKHMGEQGRPQSYVGNIQDYRIAANDEFDYNFKYARFKLE